MKIPIKRELQQTASNYLSNIKFIDLMELCKDDDKKPFHFYRIKKLYHQIIQKHLEQIYYKMTVNKKIKTVDNKKKQGKAIQFRQTNSYDFSFIIRKCW